MKRLTFERKMKYLFQSSLLFGLILVAVQLIAAIAESIKAAGY